MRRIFLFAIFMFISAAAFSQSTGGAELGLGVDFAVPVGNFGIQTNPGAGADAKIGYNLTPNWAILGQAGYIAFFTTSRLTERNIGTLSDGFFKLCGRYTTKGRVYFEPAVGFSKFSSGSINNIGGDGLTLAATVGYYANPAKTFDLSIRYETTSNSESVRFVGLRFGYRFITRRPI